jgi:hypothetical protein
MSTARLRDVFCIAVIVLGCALVVSAQKRSVEEIPMGFDPAKTVAHFYLLKNGGAIELSAKAETDKDTIDAIQRYVAAQAKAYDKGSFDIPTEMNGKPVDGVPVIKKLRKEITFEVVPMDTGAALRMLSVNGPAKQAIQDYVKFQIIERKSGDPLTVE